MEQQKQQKKKIKKNKNNHKFKMNSDLGLLSFKKRLSFIHHIHLYIQ